MKKFKDGLKPLAIYMLAILVLISAFSFPVGAYGSDDIQLARLEYIALLASNDKYVCAEDGGGREVVVNRDKIGSWETFEIILVEGSTVAFKTNNGRYLNLEDEDDGEIDARATKIGDGTKFTVYYLGDNKVALKASNGKYVALDDDELEAHHSRVKSNSTFQLVRLQDKDEDICTLAATQRDNGILFNWTKPGKTKDLIGYNLYRGTASGKQSKTPITDFPIEGTSYLDKNIDLDKTYYYILRPVYKDKVLGSASNEVEIIVNSQITLRAEAVENGIALDWHKPDYSSNIIGYYLYRGTKSGKQSATPITDFPIEKTSYTDKNIEDDTTYYYILRAVYKDKTLGVPSNEVKVKSNKSYGTIVLEIGSRYMYVDGQRREIDPGKRTEPIIKNGRTFLPIRAVIEAMGGSIEWESRQQKVTIYYKKNEIELWIGNKNARVNGTRKITDVAPYISDSNRTMLPLRFIVENLGCEADWDGVHKRVTITIRD
ncbi:stalk domain-containing protein [Alkaliphilus serpentinus]|uniref:Fibronectin type-III domain-containing protein n=1 Tax=Alkaliphilus serpentinus TaxID=1482731 RepID=A0A833HQ40_9FIRM|nr:stalk domain-containing protein [Alkaliphilus serpentinus]KAB3530502.1 hypothetical protein F8153_06525 [Alkaliphilus serpentinus]